MEIWSDGTLPGSGEAQARSGAVREDEVAAGRGRAGDPDRPGAHGRQQVERRCAGVLWGGARVPKLRREHGATRAPQSPGCARSAVPKLRAVRSPQAARAPQSPGRARSAVPRLRTVRRGEENLRQLTSGEYQRFQGVRTPAGDFLGLGPEGELRFLPAAATRPYLVDSALAQ